MKTLSKVPMELISVDLIPEKADMEFGKFYHSKKYKTASHLCACGCGEDYAVPINDGEWNITDEKKLTVSPSLNHRIRCKAHYVITKGFANILTNGRPKEEWDDQYETHAPGGCSL